jgi:hypothetical protein
MGVQELTDKKLEYILKEMFTRVGSTYSEEFCTQPDWFLKYTWTREEQHDFTDWLITYLRKSCRWSKVLATKEASWLVLYLGWKTTENTGETNAIQD